MGLPPLDIEDDFLDIDDLDLPDLSIGNNLNSPCLPKPSILVKNADSNQASDLDSEISSFILKWFYFQARAHSLALDHLLN
jgi:hypothetical protein